MAVTPLLLKFVLAAGTTLEGGNFILSIVLFVIVGLLIYGLTDPKRHTLVLAIAVLIIIAMAFAFVFGKISLVINT